jgi:hypothetical protein
LTAGDLRMRFEMHETTTLFEVSLTSDLEFWARFVVWHKGAEWEERAVHFLLSSAALPPGGKTRQSEKILAVKWIRIFDPLKLPENKFVCFYALRGAQKQSEGSIRDGDRDERAILSHRNELVNELSP